MKVKIIYSCCVIFLLSACSGNSLVPKNNDEVTVNSEPSGASVYVMGELAGVTPTVVDVDALYPVTYSQEEQQEYGLITLKHEGCSDQTIKVSSRMISNGLSASLDCQPKEQQDVKPLPVKAKSVKQRLKELQQLKDEGLINEQEYQQIRNRILGSL